MRGPLTATEFMKEFIIGPNDAAQRLDKFVLKATTGLPKSLLYKAIRTKKIKVNRKRCEIGQILQEGDSVQMFLAPDFFGEREERFLTLTPNLSVVYEDENIILCDKRAGMIVHSDDKESTNTLISHITAYLYQKGEYDPAKENSFAPALCNRIDRNTGGIVIAAKNAEALRVMNEKIKNDEISKFYYCVVHGKMPKKSDTLTGFLLKDSDKNQVKIFDKQVKGSKNIITKYKVVSEKNGMSLLEIELVTGRTHQIRAHMSYIGHPLLGDGKYGVNKDDRARGYKYQALYAYRLRFDFDDNSGALGYLKGKEVKLSQDDVWFLKDFI